MWEVFRTFGGENMEECSNSSFLGTRLFVLHTINLFTRATRLHLIITCNTNRKEKEKEKETENQPHILGYEQNLPIRGDRTPL